MINVRLPTPPDQPMRLCPARARRQGHAGGTMKISPATVPPLGRSRTRSAAGRSTFSALCSRRYCPSRCSCCSIRRRHISAESLSCWASPSVMQRCTARRRASSRSCLELRYATAASRWATIWRRLRRGAVSSYRHGADDRLSAGDLADLGLHDHSGADHISVGVLRNGDARGRRQDVK
jgi:hypothetical protein